MTGSGGADAVTTATDGSEVWAFFYMQPGVAPGDPVMIVVEGATKIRWRIPDDGDPLSEPAEPVIDAVGPGGLVIGPVDDPFFHSGSDWDRPGDEWGTGWEFPVPGCWTIRVESGGATAEISIDVEIVEGTPPATSGTG